MNTRYLQFFLPFTVMNSSSADTIQPFCSPEEAVNNPFHLVRMTRRSDMTGMLIERLSSLETGSY